MRTGDMRRGQSGGGSRDPDGSGRRRGEACARVMNRRQTTASRGVHKFDVNVRSPLHLTRRCERRWTTASKQGRAAKFTCVYTIRASGRMGAPCLA